MTNKKMTKRDYFTILRESYPESAGNYSEVVAFIDHELELLAKKNSAERKPTAVQTANEGIKAIILDGMAENTLYTISEIMKFDGMPEVTNQKTSAIVRQLVADGLVTRTEDKRKAYFTKA